MLTDKEIFDAVNEAPLGRTGQGTVISVGRAIEAAVLAALGKAAQDVLAEHHRQISAEGWTPEHDDEHDGGEMARAAACYALHAGGNFAWSESSYQEAPPHHGDPEVQDTLWPWDREWWKPKSPRRDLVRAAALLLAEIERIDRASALKVEPGPFGGTMVSGRGFRAYDVPLAAAPSTPKAAA